MIVLSADSVYELLVSGPSYQSVADQLIVAEGKYCAPPNMHFEVLQLLLDNLHAGVLSSHRDVEVRLRKLEELPLTVVGAASLVGELIRLDELSFPVSDSLYISTALRVSAALLTTREDLANRARLAKARVVHVS